MKAKNIVWALLVVSTAASINIYSFSTFSDLGTGSESGNEISKHALLSGYASAVEIIDSFASTVNHFRGHFKKFSYSHYQPLSFSYTRRIFITVDIPCWTSHTRTLPIYLLNRHLII